MQSEANLVKIRMTAAKNGNILYTGLSQTLEIRQIQPIIDKVKDAPTNIRMLWNMAQAEMKILDANFRGRACYSPIERGIRLNLDNDANSRHQKPYRNIFHEIGHMIDNFMTGYAGYKSVKFEGGLFGSALRCEANDYVLSTQMALKLDSVNEARKVISAELLNITSELQHEVSDIWHGATNGVIAGKWGHAVADYWTIENGANVAKEAFAHMFCATIQNPESLIYIRKYFPKSYEIFEEMIDKFLGGVMNNE